MRFEERIRGYLYAEEAKEVRRERMRRRERRQPYSRRMQLTRIVSGS